MISTAFYRVLKGSKKDKNMISCTRLYVDTTYRYPDRSSKKKYPRVRNGESCRSRSPALVHLKYHSLLPTINLRIPD